MFLKGSCVLLLQLQCKGDLINEVQFGPGPWDSYQIPPRNPPLYIRTEMTCIGRPNSCCPKRCSPDALLSPNVGNQAWCVENAGPECFFEVKTRTNQYRLTPSTYDVGNKYREHYGCKSNINSTLTFQLPANVFNSDDTWNEFYASLRYFVLNDTSNCFSTPWVGRIVKFNDIKSCDTPIDQRVDDDGIILNPGQDFNWTYLGDWKNYITRDVWGINFNLTKLLRSNRYGDDPGIVLQSLVDGCRLNEYHINFQPWRPVRLWQERMSFAGSSHYGGFMYRQPKTITFSGSATIRGKRGRTNLRPILPPDDLEPPSIYRFKHVPDENIVRDTILDAPPIQDDQRPEHAQVNDDDDDTPGPAFLGLNRSSCDPEVLKAQLKDIKAGQLMINPDCDYDELYPLFFDSDGFFK